MRTNRSQMKPKTVPEEEEVRAEQLEVRSSTDNAWYNATIEVLADRIHVRFVEFDEGEDEIWDTPYLRKHAGNIGNVIRLSSPQLQDEDCGSVVEGMMVCARHVLDNDKEDEVEEEVKYYDAQITKVDRNPHKFVRGEETCTCVFEAYWISGPGKKKFRKLHSSVFLGCGDICMLNPGNAELHPIVQNTLRLVGGGSGPRSHRRPVAAKQSGKSYAKGRISGSSRGREASSSEDRPMASSEQSDSNVRVTGSMLSREASTPSSADREACSGHMSEQSRESASASTAVEAEAGADEEEKENGSVISVSSDDHSTSMSSPAVRKVKKLDEVKEYTQPVTLKLGKKVVNLTSARGTSNPPRKRMRGAIDIHPAWYTPS